jgi:acetyl-CoA carboxylase biotin carboxyl carrier protein
LWDRQARHGTSPSDGGQNAYATIALTSFPKPTYLDGSTFGLRETALEPKDIKEIKAIIDLMKKNDLSVFEIEKNGFRLKLQKGPTAPMAAAAPPAVIIPSKALTGSSETTAALPKPIESKPLKEIISPMVGTFYRAGSPDGPPFVDVGKTVTEDTVVCIIEAMKVMNEIKAETSGVIAEVVAENGKPVQFGQVLFRVR